MNIFLRLLVGIPLFAVTGFFSYLLFGLLQLFANGVALGLGKLVRWIFRMHGTHETLGSMALAANELAKGVTMACVGISIALYAFLYPRLDTVDTWFAYGSVALLFLFWAPTVFVLSLFVSAEGAETRQGHLARGTEPPRASLLSAAEELAPDAPASIADVNGAQPESLSELQTESGAETLVSALAKSTSGSDRAQIVDHALGRWNDASKATQDELRAVFNACEPEAIIALVKREAVDPALRIAQTFYEAGVIQGILAMPGLSDLVGPERRILATEIDGALSSFFSVYDLKSLICDADEIGSQGPPPP